MMDKLEPLESVLQKCAIPPEFSRCDTFDDSDVLRGLDTFKFEAHTVLKQVKDLLKLRNAPSRQEQVSLVWNVAPFDCTIEPWFNTQSSSLAREILETFINSPSHELIEDILAHEIKPIFQHNPHPELNPDTGRKLPRIAGGPMAFQDYYEDQLWKQNPGIPNVLKWCVRHIKESSYERLWPLIIPPVMTLLDDYSPIFKARGAEVVQEMLKNIPPHLLKRTGVDTLLQTSLIKCLSFIETTAAQRLLPAAVRAHLGLTMITTEQGSLPWFTQMCSLLGEGIIGSIWTYCGDKPEPLLASLEVLPEVLTVFGIGSTRYLKVLIAQAVQPLSREVETDFTRERSLRLKIASLRCLRCMIKECAPRIYRWKGAILDGVCRCWVIEMESQGQNMELRGELRHTCQLLRNVCPSVVKDEFIVLLETDKKTREPLLAVDG